MRALRTALPVALVPSLLLGMALVALGPPATVQQTNAARVSAQNPCRLPAGDLTTFALPPGRNAVTCRAVGRVLRFGSIGVRIPPPGEAVGVEAITSGRPIELGVGVAPDGTVTYLTERVLATALATTSPGACTDTAYTTSGFKAYRSYEWFVGDGPMPAGLSQSAAATAFADAIDNITGSYNNCGYADEVSASATYRGTTTNEAGIASSGVCGSRDGQGTWDAGDLPVGTVAQACMWGVVRDGGAKELIEADVRFNTSDYAFTNNPTSTCVGRYDIRGVGTHEAGHVFGLSHVGSGHAQLTMYATSSTCTTKARTLGRGDVRGLRVLY